MNQEIATTQPLAPVTAGRGLIARIPTTLVKFLVVGGIGFVINEVVLFLLYDAGILPFLPGKDAGLNLLLFTVSDSRLLLASVIAVEVAIICQFNLHERWTFRTRNREGNIIARGLKFNAASIVSPIVSVICVNLLTPWIRDAAGDDSLIGKVAPYLSNGGGVLLGFTWNYLLNSLIIWPHHQQAAPAETIIDEA